MRRRQFLTENQVDSIANRIIREQTDVAMTYQGKSDPNIIYRAGKSSDVPGGSIVDFLHQMRHPYTFDARKQLAFDYMVVDNPAKYKGTAQQNTLLLQRVQAHTPEKESPRKLIGLNMMDPNTFKVKDNYVPEEERQERLRQQQMGTPQKLTPMGGAMASAPPQQQLPQQGQV